jgi:hypothetical protein
MGNEIFDFFNANRDSRDHLSKKETLVYLVKEDARDGRGGSKFKKSDSCKILTTTLKALHFEI